MRREERANSAERGRVCAFTRHSDSVKPTMAYDVHINDTT